MAKVSIILPIFNEASALESNVPRLIGHLENCNFEYELMLCEDGSSDNSAEVARSFALANKNIRPLIRRERLGRGKALANAVLEAKYNIIVYMDADLATDLKFLKPLVCEIEKGADISTGSRLLPGSKVMKRGLVREFASCGYNFLMRGLFNTGITDHQCGFKAFRKSSVLPILPEIRDSHWFWDSELLVLANRKGLKITEIPIEWADRDYSRVRLSSDILHMGISAIKLKFRA